MADYGVACVGVDYAGGVLTGLQNPTWTWNGAPFELLGDGVAAHGPSPHQGATMVEGSDWFTLNGIPVCREGNHASCGHATTGRPKFTLPG